MLGDEDAPVDPGPEDVQCTLTEAEREAREARVESELLSHALGLDVGPEGYVMRFEASEAVLDALAAFVATESRCCSFASFRIETEPPYEEVRLRMTGPEGIEDLADQGLVEAFEEATA